jgi:hypothetical protein
MEGTAMIAALVLPPMIAALALPLAGVVIVAVCIRALRTSDYREWIARKNLRQRRKAETEQAVREFAEGLKAPAYVGIAMGVLLVALGVWTGIAFLTGG